MRRYLPKLIGLVLDGKIDPGKAFDLTLPLAGALRFRESRRGQYNEGARKPR